MNVPLPEDELTSTQRKLKQARKKLAALVKAADDGSWHSSQDCEVEGRAADCDLCKALAEARKRT